MSIAAVIRAEAHPDDPHGLWRLSRAIRREGIKELGVSLLCKGYREDDEAAKAEGRMALQKGMTLPHTYPTDAIDPRPIPIILAREADACGYSRDSWEDVDPAEIPKP